MAFLHCQQSYQSYILNRAYYGQIEMCAINVCGGASSHSGSWKTQRILSPTTWQTCLRTPSINSDLWCHTPMDKRQASGKPSTQQRTVSPVHIWP